MNILIVRLGAMGDIVHAIPAAAALRAALPDARIDWLVDAKHQELLHLVTVLDRIVPLEGRSVAAWADAVRRLRQVRYDIALDFQGLMKSAVLARASGASRVAGFSIWHLREKSARPFYSETDDGGDADRPERPSTEPDDRRVRPPTSLKPRRTRQPDPGRESDQSGPPEGHVIRKNLSLLRVLDVDTDRIEFPIAHGASRAADEVRDTVGSAPFAILNPGAAWPNKRWPSDRFGAVASFLRDVRGLLSVVLWGPGEQPLAREVVFASGGAARLAPETTIQDILELSRKATLVVSGDTGPLHIAAAVGTPTVAIFGPTDPVRNGPWSGDDVILSRYDECGCHYDRRCRQRAWCLQSVSVAEVTAAIQQRLAGKGEGTRDKGQGIRDKG
jgi:heptosyltransferase I